MKRAFYLFVITFAAATLFGCTGVDHDVIPPSSEVSAAPTTEAMESLVEEGEEPNSD